MATIIRCSTGNFRGNAAGLNPPVTDGLLGWYNLGGSLAASQKNYAPGGAAAIIAGAPTVEAGALGFGGGVSYLDTGIPETASMTLLCAVQSSDAFTASGSKPTFMGNYDGTSGVILFVNGANGAAPAAAVFGAAAYDVSGTPTLGTSNTFATSLANWNLIALVIEAGVGRRNYNLTQGGTPTITADARPRVLRSGGTIRLGFAASASFKGNCKMAWAGVYAGARTEAQIQTIYAFEKADLALRGIAA
jgi:hypothetical protein